MRPRRWCSGSARRWTPELEEGKAYVIRRARGGPVGYAKAVDVPPSLDRYAESASLLFKHAHLHGVIAVMLEEVGTALDGLCEDVAGRGLPSHCRPVGARQHPVDREAHRRVAVVARDLAELEVKRPGETGGQPDVRVVEEQTSPAPALDELCTAQRIVGGLGLLRRSAPAARAADAVKQAHRSAPFSDSVMQALFGLGP